MLPCLPSRWAQCSNFDSNSILLTEKVQGPTAHKGSDKSTNTQSASTGSNGSYGLSPTGTNRNPSPNEELHQDTPVRQDIHSSTLMTENLPKFTPMPNPNFTWGNCDSESLCHMITCTYNEVIHWKKDLFRVPSGKAGNTFVHELSRLFREYANGSCLESIALKAAMIFAILLLQKPFPSSKKQTAHSSPGRTTESMEWW